MTANEFEDFVNELGEIRGFPAILYEKLNEFIMLFADINNITDGGELLNELFEYCQWYVAEKYKTEAEIERDFITLVYTEFVE